MASKYFLSLFTGILLLLSLSALGQDGDYPKVEVFGGFSLLENVDDDNDETFYGWQASIIRNFHENIGIVVDVGGQYQSGIQLYEFLVGPRITVRTDSGSLFGHALAGLNYGRISGLGPSPLPGLGDTISDTAFAIGFGGGADVNVGDWTIRMLQVDGIGNRVSGLAEWSWNYRLSMGLVFKFGD